MTLEETRDILTVLKANYPNSFKNMTGPESKNILMLWSEAFKTENVNDVIKAVKEIIYTDTREFAPNIAQVKAKIKPQALLEDTNAIMRKYDKHYEEGYTYREDEMINRLLHNPFHIDQDEMKADFLKCIGLSYDFYMKDIDNFLKGIGVK